MALRSDDVRSIEHHLDEAVHMPHRMEKSRRLQSESPRDGRFYLLLVQRLTLDRCRLYDIACRYLKTCFRSTLEAEGSHAPEQMSLSMTNAAEQRRQGLRLPCERRPLSRSWMNVIIATSYAVIVRPIHRMIKGPDHGWMWIRRTGDAASENDLFEEVIPQIQRYHLTFYTLRLTITRQRFPAAFPLDSDLLKMIFTGHL